MISFSKRIKKDSFKISDFGTAANKKGRPGGGRRKTWKRWK
jgi:hypothetical protein